MSDDDLSVERKSLNRFFNLFTQHTVHFTPEPPILLGNDRITDNTPVLVRSLKLSSVERSQYLDGGPLGNTACRWHPPFYPFWAISNRHLPFHPIGKYCSSEAPFPTPISNPPEISQEYAFVALKMTWW